jgi:hypothetical protein
MSNVIKKISRPLLSLTLSCGLVAGVAGLAAYNNFFTGSTPAQAAEVHHPKIHAALDALHDAREELENSHEDFRGHKDVALHAVDEAIHQLKDIIDHD